MTYFVLWHLQSILLKCCGDPFSTEYETFPFALTGSHLTYALPLIRHGTGWSQLKRHKGWSIRKYAGDYWPWLNVGQYTKVYLVYRARPPGTNHCVGNSEESLNNDDVFYMHNYQRLRARSYASNYHGTALKSGENNKKENNQAPLLFYPTVITDVTFFPWYLYYYYYFVRKSTL